MVYSFPLPTTSHLSFQSYLSSSTHPSLPQLASTARHGLRFALKSYKRLHHTERVGHLPSILDALNDYLPYLFAISNGLSDKPVGVDGEEVEITLRAEIEVEWRPTLTCSASILKGIRDGGRIRGRGLDFEVSFVLTTLGYVLSGLARYGVLQTMYSPSTPTPGERTTAIQTATRQLLQASATHLLLASFPSFSFELAGAVVVSDLDPGIQAALSTLALAEATLLAVLKDDAYTSACIQSRNPHDKEWMVRAPEIPKVRALLFVRLCVRGAEYAEQAADGLGAFRGSDKVDEDLIKYAQQLGRVARARACRFFAVDAELAGKVGDGIAWLRAGRGALGFKSALEDDQSTGKRKGGLSKLRQDWTERREERKIEKGADISNGRPKGWLDWGDDAGWEEEYRVLEMLETKWVKMNDTINTQLIPSSTPLLSKLPSGRDIHTPPGPYVPPSLDKNQLVRMRAPPEDEETSDLGGNDSDEEADASSKVSSFPGPKTMASDAPYY
ncbi:hypothetical protein V8E54_014044 [Elaphomyces granulatus]